LQPLPQDKVREGGHWSQLLCHPEEGTVLAEYTKRPGSYVVNSFDDELAVDGVFLGGYCHPGLFRALAH